MDENSQGGAPSLYRGEYCQQLIDHMAGGLSYESFAGVIGVDRTTLYAWERNYEGFSDAKKRARELNLLFWERQGIDGLYSTTEYNDKGKPTKSKSLNSAVYIFNMKNRHNWRDRQPGESDVVINNVNNVADEVLDAKIATLVKKLAGVE